MLVYVPSTAVTICDLLGVWWLSPLEWHMSLALLSCHFFKYGGASTPYSDQFANHLYIIKLFSDGWCSLWLVKHLLPSSWSPVCSSVFYPGWMAGL